MVRSVWGKRANGYSGGFSETYIQVLSTVYVDFGCFNRPSPHVYKSWGKTWRIWVNS